MLSEREKFEAMFPMPPGCVHCGEGFAPTSYSAWKAHDYIEQWKGWRARAAIESAATAPLLACIAELEAQNNLLHRLMVSGEWRGVEKGLEESSTRIAELTRELEEAPSRTLLDAATKEIDNLTRELEEARKDAERYRCLVRLFGVTKLPCLLEPVVGDYVADGKESLDAAIDAARAAIKEQT